MRRPVRGAALFWFVPLLTAGGTASGRFTILWGGPFFVYAVAQEVDVMADVVPAVNGKGSGLGKLLEKAACKVTVLVLAAEKWEFADNNTYGSRVHWCQIGSMETGSINGWVPKVSKLTEEDKASGHALFAELSKYELPAYFEADMFVMPKSQTLANFRHIASLEAAPVAVS